MLMSSKYTLTVTPRIMFDQIFWPPDAKNWLIGKDPDAGKDWRQREKGTTEDEMVGCLHWLDRQEFEQTPGVGDGQGGLVCCSPWGCKESETTERLNWTELNGNILTLHGPVKLTHKINHQCHIASKWQSSVSQQWWIVSWQNSGFYLLFVPAPKLSIHILLN